MVAIPLVSGANNMVVVDRNGSEFGSEGSLPLGKEH